MGRHAVTLAEISPADIIAHTNAIPDEAYELLDAFPGEIEALEQRIATAVTALLPDELIIHDELRAYPDHKTRVWLVLQGLNPETAKPRPGHRPTVQDEATGTLLDAIAWLADLDRIADAINLDTLVSDAVHRAELAAQADV